MSLIEKLRDRRVCSLAHNSCYNDTRIEEAVNAFDRIRVICEDGERSGADRLDEICRIVTGEG